MPTTQQEFDALETAFKYNSIEKIKKTLRGFDFTDRDENGFNCLMLGCYTSSSPDVVKLIFEEIEKVGGKRHLKSQIAATNYYNWNCLMCSCSESSSLQVVNLIVEKIIEVGGTAMLKSHISATNSAGYTCLMLASSPQLMKLIASLLFVLNLFKEEYAKLKWPRDNEFIKKRAKINAPSWTPDSESLAEAEILLEGGSLNNNNEELGNLMALWNFINKNDQSKMKELLENLDAKKILASKINIVMLACCAHEATIETVKLLFSEIKRIGGGDLFLKELVSKENNAGETCLLSVCLRFPERLELFLNTIQELGGEEFLAEQIAKRRRSDDTSCISALCKNAPRLSSLSLLVGKICQLVAGRRFLKQLLNVSDSCFDCIFSSPHVVVSAEEGKVLLFISCLYSMTGLFEFQYSRLDNEKKEKLRQLCKIQSGDWTRAQSVASSMNNEVGNIKKRIQNCN